VMVRGAIRHPRDAQANTIFFVDRGARDGVVHGNIVYADTSTALGYVSYVTHTHAVVVPFTRPDTRLPVVLMEASSTVHVVAEGQGADTMVITVPRDVPTMIDGAVLLPHRETSIIGYVRAIKVDPEDAFKRLFVRPAANVRTLRFVWIDTESALPDDDALVMQAQDVLDATSTNAHSDEGTR